LQILIWLEVAVDTRNTKTNLGQKILMRNAHREDKNGKLTISMSQSKSLKIRRIIGVAVQVVHRSFLATHRE